MNLIHPLLLGLKLLYQQWNRTLINILALSFILSITLLTAINTLSDRINDAITVQSNQLLGAPWLISSSRPFDEAWVAKAASMGLRHTTVTEFMTMAGYKDQTMLASIKAVERPYPLVGAFISSDKDHALPSNSGLWITQDWIDRYGVKIGDTLHIGDLPLKVTGIIEREPDVTVNFVNFAPRVIIQRSVLPLTHVIAPGSRVEYRLLLDGPPELLTQYAAWIKPLLNENQRIIAADTDRPELNETLLRAKNYLILVSFASIILAATTIFMVMREYANDQINVVALLRTLGTSRTQLFIIYLGALCVVGLVLSGIAVELGYLIQNQLSHHLMEHYKMSLPPAEGGNYFLGILTGIIMLMGISLPLLLSLIRTPPMRILQNNIASPKPDIYALIAFIGISFFALLAIYSNDIELSAKAMVLIIATAGLCSLATAIIITLVYRATPWILMPYRLGVTRIRHHLNDSIMQIIGTTMCITLILSLTFIRFELLSEWRESLPEKTPNHFIYNIVPEDLKKIMVTLEEHKAVSTPFFPIVMARLTAINDKPVANLTFEADDRPNYLKRELNNTAMDEPRDTDILVEGEWWPENTEDSLVSVESSIAKKLNIMINDILTFRSGDRVFTASVANIREVDWSNFLPNFYMIFSNYTLKDYPRTYMASFYYPGGDQSLTKALASVSTSATTISVTELLKRVKEIVDQSSNFMSILLAVIALSTMLLLYTIQCAQARVRSSEDIILRVIGATGQQLLHSFLVEVLVLSMISAASAYTIAYWMCDYLSTTVFEFEGSLPLTYLFISFVIAFTIQSLTGVRSILKIRAQAPQLSMTQQ